MKKVPLILLLILSGCAVLGNSMGRAALQGDIASNARKSCGNIYDQQSCRKVYGCIIESKNMKFTYRDTADYSIGLDYEKNIYKNDDHSASLYNIWHPELLVYKENNEKRHAQLRKKEKNFQIVRNEIQRCFSENGMDVHKVLNSYKP